MNIRKNINNVLRRHGYSVEHYDEVGGLSFGLYQYRDTAGGFDDERYKEVQTAGNVRKTPTKGRYDRSHGMVIQRSEKPDAGAQPRIPDPASRAT